MHVYVQIVAYGTFSEQTLALKRADIDILSACHCLTYGINDDNIWLIDMYFYVNIMFIVVTPVAVGSIWLDRTWEGIGKGWNV